MTIEVGGMHTEATVWGAALLMLHGWAAWPAVVLALSMFILPLLQIALLLWVLGFARFGRRAPGRMLALNIDLASVMNAGRSKSNRMPMALWRAHFSRTERHGARRGAQG
jgi:hypothetical protein